MTISKTGGKLSIDRLDPQAITALEGEFDFLQIVNGGEVWKDLYFLGPYAHKVKGLRVSGICDGFAGLNALTQLAQLDIDDYPPDPVVDFSPLVHLATVRMGWSSKMKAVPFFSLPCLQEVDLISFKAMDCNNIGLANRLLKLQLRHGSLESLDGLGGCTVLEELRLKSVRKLTSLHGIERCKELKVIEFVKGSVLQHIDESLSELSGLTEVLLEGKFDVPTLGWIRHNPLLARFRSDAPVLDIDWSALFGAPHLWEVAFVYQSGALPPDEEIKSMASMHGKTLHWIEHGGTRKVPWIELHFRRN
jgi:hypothetical protein